MSKKFGFELLHQQVVDHVDGELMWMINERETGDSEIEKLFFLALLFRTQFGLTEYVTLLKPTDEAMEARLMCDCPDPHTSLIVRPQAQIGDYRVDFLIHSSNLRAPGDNRVWRRLVVECDGHNFHERTKEQAAKDRARDRWLTSKDYDVFRFTGSELWRNPMECAEQVTNWALKGWF
jgi:very-short-patch-repair endonuclease